jgi:hypothetical protein
MADPNFDPPQAPPGLRRARSVFRPGRDSAVREESLRLVRAALEKAGFEAARFEDLRRRNDSELREALAESRAAADERAPAMRDAVSRSSETWLRANGVRDALPPPGVYYLDTADRISVAPGFQFLSENRAPWANRAEVILNRRAPDSGDFFDGQVTFNFSWENPTGQTSMFNVTALLGVTASCIVTADGYWFPLSWTIPASRLDAYARLRITQLEHGHVVEPPYQSDQTVEILPNLGLLGSWGEGTIASQDVFRTYVLQYLGLAVPANGRVELDLSCEVNWFASDGGGFFIAAGGGRQVTGWGVIITAA